MKKRLIYYALCLSLVFLYAGLAIFSSKEPKNMPSENRIEKSIDIYRPQPTQMTIPQVSPAPIITYYFLQNEDNTLSLYEVCGGEKNIIKQTQINADILPHEDRIKLERGITLTTAEEAYLLIEDFSS